MEGQASDEELDDAPSTPRAWAGSDLDVAPNTPVPVTPNDSDADDDIDDDVQLGRVVAAPARWADVYDDDEDASGPGTDLAQQGAAARELTDDIVKAVNVGALRPIAVKERVRRICQVSGMDEGETRRTVAELFSPPRVNAELAKD